MQRFITNQEYIPKTLIRNLNEITLSWKHIYNSNANTETYKLQICDHVKEWKTIYWGKCTQFNVTDLTPCTSYDFRIQLKPEGNWTHFKAATDNEGPYSLVLHMSRAVKLGKMPLIRKIAHNKRHLLETENKENKTPIVQAIHSGDIQILQLLINLGAKVNTALSYTKRTPLMVAVFENKLDMASLLVDKGADVTATDVNGLNVLHYAVDSNSSDSVKFALNLGLNINSIDNKKWTALLRAAILNVSEEIVNLLLENGADVRKADIHSFDFEKHRVISSSYQTKKNKSH